MGTTRSNLMRQVPGLLAFQMRRARSHGRRLRTWTRLPAICDWKAFPQEIRAELADVFRLVPDQVRIIDIAAAALRLPAAATPRRNDAAGLLRDVIDEQRQVLRVADHGEDMAGRVGAASRTAANALRHGQRPDLAEHIERASAAALVRAKRGGPGLRARCNA